MGGARVMRQSNPNANSTFPGAPPRVAYPEPMYKHSVHDRGRVPANSAAEPPYTVHGLEVPMHGIFP